MKPSADMGSILLSKNSKVKSKNLAQLPAEKLGKLDVGIEFLTFYF